MPYYSSAARARWQRRRLASIILLTAILVSLCALAAYFASSLVPTTPPSPPGIAAIATSSVSSSISPTPLPPSAPTKSPDLIYQLPETKTREFNSRPGSTFIDALRAAGLPPEETTFLTDRAGLAPADALPTLGNLTDITGAVYDPATTRLIFLGIANPALPALDPSDFVVALRSVYAGNDNLGVSIDPTQPNQRSGPMKVRYDGDTAGTHFGLVMFEADRYLKSLSSGRDNLTGKPVTSTVPGFQSELEISLQNFTGTREARWHRMWFLPQNKAINVRESSDRRTLFFDSIPIVVEARFVQFDSAGAAHDIPGSDPTVDQFVNHFNSHFAEFAAEKREVGQLVQLTKWVALAKWLKEQNASVDWKWLNNFAPPRVDTPTTTPSQTVTAERTVTTGNVIETRQVSIFGGVDLGATRLEVKPLPPTDPDAGLASAAKGRSAGDVTPVEFGAHRALAVSVSLERNKLVGAFTQRRADLALTKPGASPFELTPNYDPADTTASIFGRGWSVEPARVTLTTSAMDVNIAGRQTSVYPVVQVSQSRTRKTWTFNIRQTRTPEGINYQFRYLGDLLVYESADPEVTFQSDMKARELLFTQGRQVTRFNFDGALIREVAPDGLSTTWIRGADGALSEIARSDGLKIQFARAGDELQARSGDQIARYRVRDGLLIDAVNARGERTEYTYAGDQLDAWLDARGAWRIELDPFDRVTRLDTPSQTVEMAYSVDDPTLGTIKETHYNSFKRDQLTHGEIKPGTVAALDEATLKRTASALTNARVDRIAVRPLERAAIVWSRDDAQVILPLNAAPDSFNRFTGGDTGTMFREMQSEGRYVSLVMELERGNVIGVADDGTVAVNKRVIGNAPGMSGAELIRLASNVAAQQEQVPAWSIYQAEGKFYALGPDGALNPFLVGVESTIKAWSRRASEPDGKRVVESLAAKELAFGTRKISVENQNRWNELAITAYHLEGESDAVIAQVVDTLKQANPNLGGELRPGNQVELVPIVVSFKSAQVSNPTMVPMEQRTILLPQPSWLFIDVPPSLRDFMNATLGANMTVPVAPASTPLHAQTNLSDPASIKSLNAIVPTSWTQGESANAIKELPGFFSVRTVSSSADARALIERGRPDELWFVVGHHDLKGIALGNDVFFTAQDIPAELKSRFGCIGCETGEFSGRAVENGSTIGISTTRPIFPSEAINFLRDFGNQFKQQPGKSVHELLWRARRNAILRGIFGFDGESRAPNDARAKSL